MSQQRLRRARLPAEVELERYTNLGADDAQVSDAPATSQSELQKL